VLQNELKNLYDFTYSKYAFDPKREYKSYTSDYGYGERKVIGEETGQMMDL